MNQYPIQGMGHNMPTIFSGTSIPYKRPTLLCFAFLFTQVVTGCNETASPSKSLTSDVTTNEIAAVVPKNPDKNAYFGDLHVDSSYSFDAFLFGVRAKPDDAYRFAQSASLDHVGGFEMKLKSAGAD